MKRRVEIPAERLPPPGLRSLFRHEEKCVVLFNLDGTLHAIDDSCPHNGASLFSGKLEGRLLRCPAHGLRFDLNSGCAHGVEGFGVARYPIEQRDGAYYIEFSDAGVRDS